MKKIRNFFSVKFATLTCTKPSSSIGSFCFSLRLRTVQYCRSSICLLERLHRVGAWLPLDIYIIPQLTEKVNPFYEKILHKFTLPRLHKFVQIAGSAPGRVSCWMLSFFGSPQCTKRGIFSIPLFLPQAKQLFLLLLQGT